MRIAASAIRSRAACSSRSGIARVGIPVVAFTGASGLPFGLRLLSTRNASKPLSIALAALIGIVLTDPRVVAAFRRRSVFAFLPMM